jgi:hypothetical protein
MKYCDMADILCIENLVMEGGHNGGSLCFLIFFCHLYMDKDILKKI